MAFTPAHEAATDFREERLRLDRRQDWRRPMLRAVESSHDSSPRPTTPMSNPLPSPRRQVRRKILAEPLPVRPLITTDCELTPCPIAGFARSKTEAIRVSREAGWRVMHRFGLIGVCPSDSDGDQDEWVVTVHPPAEPVVWYDHTGRRTLYDIAAQQGRL